MASSAIVPTRLDFHTDVGSPLIGLVDQRWCKTVPLFCLCNVYTDDEAQKRCSVPTLEAQCEGGVIKCVYFLAVLSSIPKWYINKLYNMLLNSKSN